MKAMFRTWIGTTNVIAILPEIEANPGLLMMYEHIGQHGEGDPGIVRHRTRPATPSEYHDLKRELERIYEQPITVIKRLTRR